MLSVSLQHMLAQQQDTARHKWEYKKKATVIIYLRGYVNNQNMLSTTSITGLEIRKSLIPVHILCKYTNKNIDHRSSIMFLYHIVYITLELGDITTRFDKQYCHHIKRSVEILKSRFQGQFLLFHTSRLAFVTSWLPIFFLHTNEHHDQAIQCLR